MPEIRNWRNIAASVHVEIDHAHGDHAREMRHRRAGHTGPIPVRVVNGLPEFKPYVYRGTKREDDDA